MSIKKTLSLSRENYKNATSKHMKKAQSFSNGEAMQKGEVNSKNGGKKRRLDRSGCFSFMEIKMEPASSLKEVDSNKLKAEIVRWAKAVVAYARQVSGKFVRSSSSSAGG